VKIWAWGATCIYPAGQHIARAHENSVYAAACCHVSTLNPSVERPLRVLSDVPERRAR